MAASLGTLTLDLVARIGNFVEPMRQAESQSQRSVTAIERHADSASSSIKGMAASALGLLSVGAIFGKFAQNTRDAEQEQTQLAAVLRATGQAAGYTQDQLNDMTSAMKGAPMVSGGDINQAQIALLAFTNIAGKEFPRALQSAIDMSIRTGSSLTSAAETIGRALDVPSQGLSALSKQGFRFTEDQKALVEQLEKTGRAAEAQGIILAALESTYGGAAEAARGTFDGALTSLNNTIDDLLTGDGSLDLATNAINNLTDALASDQAKQAVDLLTASVVGLATVFAGRLVASSAASSVAFIAATREAMRYNAALAAMAGLSTRAAAAQGVLAGATRAGGALLGVFGGPVGLAATVALTAGSYLLLSDNASDADMALSSSAKYAGLTTEQFIKLKAAQQDVTKNELTSAFNAQGLELDQLNSKYAALINSLIFYAKQQGLGTKNSGEFLEIQKGLGNGTLNYADALDRLNKLDFLTNEQKKQALDAIDAYNKQYAAVMQTGNSLDAVGLKYTIAGSAAQNAATGISASGTAAADATGKVNGLTEAMQNYVDKTKQGIFANSMQLNLRGQGYTPDQSKALTDVVAANEGKPITPQQAALALAGVASNNALAASNKQLASTANTAKKAEDEKAAAIKKSNDEQQQQLEKQADLRKSISSTYASVLEQNRFGYTDSKNDILGAGFSEADQKKYLSLAQRYYQKIDDEYFKHLNLELKEQTWTEQQKLDYAYKMDKKILANDITNLDEITSAKREALDRTYAYETQQIALQNKKELLDLRQNYTSQTDYMTERYKLEREEIALTQGKSEEWKKSALEASKTNEFMERQSIEAAAFGTFSSAFDDPAKQQQDQYDSELTKQGDLLNQKLISYEQYQQSYAAITEKYTRQEQEQQYNLHNAMLGQAATVWGGMTELVKKSSGESSGAYKTMFLVQQAFAIAQALINTELAATQALTLGPILGIPAATIVRGLGYASVGLIAAQTVAGIAGQAHDGIMEVPDSGTWNLQKGERVLPQKTAARLDRTLDRVQGGAAPKVTINNYGSDRVEVTADGNGGLTIDIVQQMIDRRAPAAVANDLSGSNSVTRRAITNNFNVAPSR